MINIILLVLDDNTWNHLTVIKWKNPVEKNY